MLTVEERLSQVERSVRRWRTAFFSIIAAGLCFFLVAAGREPTWFDTLQCEDLTIGTQGSGQVSISTRENKAEISMECHTSVSAQKHGVINSMRLAVIDDLKFQGWSLQLLQADATDLSKVGAPKVVMSATKLSQPNAPMIFRDANGKQLLSLPQVAVPQQGEAQ